MAEKSGRKYEISQEAYVKLVLHSLKHPYAPVNAAVIGRASSDLSVISIIDAIPLFHSNLALLPSLEISFLLIEEYCSSFQGERPQIVGYFHANERRNDCELDIMAKDIAEHVNKLFPLAPILMLDSNKLETLEKEKHRSPVLQLYTMDASKNWRRGGENGDELVLKELSANAVLLDFMANEKWNDIVDFDEHLTDITKNWLNPNLFD